MARHLETMRNKHAITLEHLRMGALKGIILDADGSTLYNLYDEFGITPKAINFALATDSTNVRQKCVDTLAHIEENLRGEFMTNVRCLCSPEFFEKLIAHPKVESLRELPAGHRSCVMTCGPASPSAASSSRSIAVRPPMATAPPAASSRLAKRMPSP